MIVKNSSDLFEFLVNHLDENKINKSLLAQELEIGTLRNLLKDENKSIKKLFKVLNEVCINVNLDIEEEKVKEFKYKYSKAIEALHDLESSEERQRAYVRDSVKRLRQYRRENKLCVSCGKPIEDERYKNCKSCRLKAAKNAKKKRL